jgi:hypothetical protein
MRAGGKPIEVTRGCGSLTREGGRWRIDNKVPAFRPLAGEGQGGARGR